MKSKTDWVRLESGDGNVKTTPEHPEADVKHIVRGIVRRGLKPLPPRPLFLCDWIKMYLNGLSHKVLGIRHG